MPKWLTRIAVRLVEPIVAPVIDSLTDVVFDRVEDEVKARLGRRLSTRELDIVAQTLNAVEDRIDRDGVALIKKALRGL